MQLGAAYSWPQQSKSETKVLAALKMDQVFGAPTKLENELAEIILSRIPFIDKIRFVSSGTGNRNVSLLLDWQEVIQEKIRF